MEQGINNFANNFATLQPIAECYMCNRVFISTNPEHITPEELDRYRQLSYAQADKYYVSEDHSLVPTFDFCGATIVIGCPCGATEKVEVWLVENKQKIQNYLGA